MKLITTQNGYKYWLGTAKGRPIFNATPEAQNPPVTGYANPEYLQAAKGGRLDLEIFTPYLITEERITAALKAATVSRGNNEGMLKAKCPEMGTDAAAAWQAIIGFANPHKLGMLHMHFMRDTELVVYNYFVRLIETKMVDVRAMDRDRKVLDLILNVW